MIREIVEKFNRENGNTSYTQKDLLIYLVTKVDGIDTRLSRLEGIGIAIKIALPVIFGALGWGFIELYKLKGVA